MCKQITAVDFRNSVIELAKNKDHNTIFDYLRTTGMVINDRNGLLTIDDDCMNKVKFFTSKIEIGDAVWNAMCGIMLVVDTHPAVNNDGNHYRALFLSTDLDGHFKIDGSKRSAIITDALCFKIAHTSFDMKLVEKLSYERYLAYSRIAEINDQLNNMNEVKDNE